MNCLISPSTLFIDLEMLLQELNSFILFKLLVTLNEVLSLHFLLYNFNTHSFSGGSEDYSSPVYASSLRPTSNSNSNEALRGTLCRLPADFLKVRKSTDSCLHVHLTLRINRCKLGKE